MTVYAIGKINVRDARAYRRYEAGFKKILLAHSGTILAGDAQPRLVEGDWQDDRVVLLSFPDEAAFDAWYNSEDYQNLRKHRTDVSTATIIVTKAWS